MKCIANINDRNEKINMSIKKSPRIEDIFRKSNTKNDNKIIMNSKFNKNNKLENVKEIELNNVWVPKNINTTSKLSRKMTNTECVRRVPTTSKNMNSCMQCYNTTNKLKRPIIKNEEINDDISFESILDANINIFMTSKINSFKVVKEKSSEIDKAVHNANEKIGKNIISLPDKIGLCTNREEFDKYLDIYHLNQQYYINKLNDNINDYIDDINKLEQWFINIIPFKSMLIKRLDLWLKSELFKIENKRTIQCSPKLVPYINNIDISYNKTYYLTDNDMVKYAKNKGVNLH